MTRNHTPPPPAEHLAAPETRRALRIQHVMLCAARDHLAGLGFVELLPPVIGPVTDPGIRGAGQVDVDFYGRRYKLMTSAILYKQASLLAFDRIFYLAPNVRLEPPETRETGRHLVEFHQLDVELAGADRDTAMAVAEGLVSAMVEAVAREARDDLAALGRDPDTLAKSVAAPYPRISHAEAVARLRGMGHPQAPDAEIDWEAERLLSERETGPFFVVDYPKGSRGFYDRESREHPGTLCNFDLIAGEGFGELASGGEREHAHPDLIDRIRESGEDPAAYGWYLELARTGIPSSAGFGIGVERLVRYVTGLAAVWQVSAYPKLAGLHSP